MDGQQNEKKEIGDHLFSWKRNFDNFIYHHKIALIMGAAILAFVIFCITQCAQRTPGDVNVAYIGITEINSEHYANLQSALCEMLGEDLNGDGKIQADFTHFLYMTQSQVDSVRASGKPVDMQALMTVQTQLDLEFAAGSIVIYFIDRDVYKELSGRQGLFMPLEDSLGFIPEDANDAYSLKMGNLQSWEYFMGLNDFPAGTVIAVRDIQLSEENDPKKLELYERNLKMLKRIYYYTYKTENEEE